MDIKQGLQACALVTLGKDMSLRDYAQGCWRMRGPSGRNHVPGSPHTCALLMEPRHALVSYQDRHIHVLS